MMLAMEDFRDTVNSLETQYAITILEKLREMAELAKQDFTKKQE